VVERLPRAVFICGFLVAAMLLAACSPAARPGPQPESPRSIAPVVPAEFVTFAEALQAYQYSTPTTGTAWYPTYLPPGFALGSVETTGLAEGAAPVCDVMFVRRSAKIFLDQGSPVLRDYQIMPIDSIPWGSAAANAMDADGEPGGAFIIVYSDSRNLAELSSGDVTADELKRIAASMQPVP
jgi:hypothetical protein